MLKLFNEGQKLLTSGSDCVLAVIVDSGGSVPRGQGAKMLVWAEGSTGTVGGGLTEHEARLKALELLDGRRSAVCRFTISQRGFVSGWVDIAFLYFDHSKPESLDFHNRAVSALSGSTRGWLSIKHEDGTVSDFGISDSRTGDGYCEHLGGAGRVVLYGAGHVARCTCRALASLGLRIWVTDQREQNARPEYFPGAEKVLSCGWDETDELVELESRDSVMVLLGEIDLCARFLCGAVRAGCDYIGLLGSKKKIALIYGELRRMGVGESDIARIHAPIGLEIGAVTPEELAVSIAAEYIMHTNTGADKH